MRFQSTPPARGATFSLRLGRQQTLISIHAPREGGDLTDLQAKVDANAISIHAPREGGDMGQLCQRAGPPGYFNPRPPRGGRPPQNSSLLDNVLISIHAPREGGDLMV